MDLEKDIMISNLEKAHGQCGQLDSTVLLMMEKAEKVYMVPTHSSWFKLINQATILVFTLETQMLNPQSLSTLMMERVSYHTLQLVVNLMYISSFMEQPNKSFLSINLPLANHSYHLSGHSAGNKHHGSM